LKLDNPNVKPSSIESIATAMDEVLAGMGFEFPPVPARVLESWRPWRMWAHNTSACVDFAMQSGIDGEHVEWILDSKMAGCHRGRVYADGRREALDAPQHFTVFDPNIPGDEEAAQLRTSEHNRPIEEAMARIRQPTPDHSLVRDTVEAAIPILVRDWREILNPPGGQRERLLRAVIRDEIVAVVGAPLVEVERRVELGEGWPNVPPKFLGGIDLLVRYGQDGRWWRYLAEIKWSVAGTKSGSKIYEVLWDAFKMVTASELPYVEAAYLIALAPRSEWEARPACAEFFDGGAWSVADLLDEYRSEWAHLVKHSGSPPVHVPGRFKSTPVFQQAVNGHVLKVCSLEAEFASVPFVFATA
jgi:hypothetical protein